MNPLSGVLGEAWTLYRAHAAHLLAIAFVIYLITAVVTAILTRFLGGFGALVALVVELVAAFLLQAALVKAVQDIRDGRADLSFGQTFSAATPYLGAVAGASILAGIAITIGFILIIVPGLILLTIWAVIVPAIVIGGGGGPLAASGRRGDLVGASGWRSLASLWLCFRFFLVAGFFPTWTWWPCPV